MSITLPDFEYFKPKTLNQAVELLDRYGEEARVLAGGTDLIVSMRDRVLTPRYLIDIKDIEELRRCSYHKGEGLTIGSTATLNEVAEQKAVKERYHALHDALKDMCDELLRNRATLVGNICNASPAADCAPPLMVLDATVEAASVEGRRTIEINNFFAGVKKTSLKPNELVTVVHVPELPEEARSRYVRGKRTSEDLALVGVAALVANVLEPAKRIIRLAFSSVGPTPIRALEVDEVFKKDQPLSELTEEALSAVMKKVTPISDVRAGKEYRLHLVDTLTRLVLKELLGGE